MHTLTTKPITEECFERDDYIGDLVLENFEISSLTSDESATWDFTINDKVNLIIEFLEQLRQKYIETKDIRYWKELIRWLPESWLQTRTWTCNYANLRNICKQRKNHKLTEWHQFIDWVKTLPYSNELIFVE